MGNKKNFEIIIKALTHLVSNLKIEGRDTTEIKLILQKLKEEANKLN